MEKYNNILIIDDDEEMCEEMKELLCDSGYYVNSVNDGTEGIKMINENIYRVVLLDLKMPKISGRDVLKYIKSNNPETKVIVLTGSFLGNERDIENPLDINFDNALNPENEILKQADYILKKPFDIEKLLSKIERFIS